MFQLNFPLDYGNDVIHKYLCMLYTYFFTVGNTNRKQKASWKRARWIDKQVFTF